MPDAVIDQRQSSMDAIERIREYNERESPRAAADVEAEKTAKERILAMPAELLRASYVTLCSIWPEKLTSQCFHHGGVGRKFYYMEPGSPKRPSYLNVQNTFDIVIGQSGMDRADRAEPILAVQIANDMIMHWTGDHPANARGKKGIGVIKGTLINGEIHATPEEVAHLEKLQNGFLGFLVDRADEHWMRGERGKITQEHKKAVQILGLDEKQHQWINNTVQKYNTCPWCSGRMPVEAIFCRECRMEAAPYYMDRDMLPEGWPSVMAEIERLKKKQAKEESGF